MINNRIIAFDINKANDFIVKKEGLGLPKLEKKYITLEKINGIQNYDYFINNLEKFKEKIKISIEDGEKELLNKYPDAIVLTKEIDFGRNSVCLNYKRYETPGERVYKYLISSENKFLCVEDRGNISSFDFLDNEISISIDEKIKKKDFMRMLCEKRGMDALGQLAIMANQGNIVFI